MGSERTPVNSGSSSEFAKPPGLLSCTLLIGDGGRLAPNQGWPVRLFGFCPKRVLGTERVTEISFGTLCPGGGRFQASPAEGTFEHFSLLQIDIAQEHSQSSYDWRRTWTPEVLIRNGGNTALKNFEARKHRLSRVDLDAAIALSLMVAGAKRFHEQLRSLSPSATSRVSFRRFVAFYREV